MMTSMIGIATASSTNVKPRRLVEPLRFSERAQLIGTVSATADVGVRQTFAVTEAEPFAPDVPIAFAVNVDPVPFTGTVNDATPLELVVRRDRRRTATGELDARVRVGRPPFLTVTLITFVWPAAVALNFTSTLCVSVVG